MSSENILGYEVYSRSHYELVRDISSVFNTRSKGKILVCLNPHSYVESKSNRRFSAAIKSADWVVPDGVGIVLASRMLGGYIKDRITGADVFKLVTQCLNDNGGGKVFFLGSTEAVLRTISKKMSIEYPNIIVGSFSPPYKNHYSDEENQQMIDVINSMQPDILWVGMTSPKQDVWLLENISRLNVKFAAGIGAVFDFYSGRIKRSHEFYRKYGLEWLPRLIQEPRRLWRRTIVSVPIFLLSVIWFKINKAKL